MSTAALATVVTPITRRKGRGTPAADIVSGLRADGLLPFRVSLSLEEALPLSCFLRDRQAAWGHSGALHPVRLDQEPSGSSGGRAWQPPIPADAGIRVELTWAGMRHHERDIVVWLDKARGRSNITLARAGHEWCPFAASTDQIAANYATGLMKALCRTLAEAYPIDNYRRSHPS